MASKPQVGRNFKLECPTCEMVLRVSRGAIIRHGMPSCGCGSRFFFSDLAVALDVTPDLAHEHPDFAAWTERQVQSAIRQAARVGAQNLRCGGCPQWIPATNHLCMCGFHNDLRGRRNYGRWVAGASRIAAEMPF